MRNCAVTLLCPQCGKPFQTTASRKTYCSPKCLREHDNEMDRRNNLVRSAISSKQTNSQAESNKELLSISAAARFLGVSRPTIYAYIKEGKLSPIRKSDAIIRIPMSQLTQTEHKTTTIPDEGTKGFITKAEAIRKYKISETWFHRRIKERHIKSIRIGAKSYYEASTVHLLFKKEDHPEVQGWYTSAELAVREGITRKHICATAHKLGIPVKRAGSVCYIAKEAWDNRKLAPAIIERDYMTADQAKKHYRIGGKHFYDQINANTVHKVKKGNFVYFLTTDLDRLFKDKGPHIPEEIKRNYICSQDALKLYHVGQKRFSADTQAAGVEKVKTEGNYVWYRKDQLDKLFKTLI